MVSKRREKTYQKARNPRMRQCRSLRRCRYLWYGRVDETKPKDGYLFVHCRRSCLAFWRKAVVVCSTVPILCKHHVGKMEQNLCRAAAGFQDTKRQTGRPLFGRLSLPSFGPCFAMSPGLVECGALIQKIIYLQKVIGRVSDSDMMFRYKGYVFSNFAYLRYKIRQTNALAAALLLTLSFLHNLNKTFHRLLVQHDRQGIHLVCALP